jgi:tetratricopeptide (TPR) repeat protein
MKSIAKLKERARLHEQEEQWAEAIQVYQQAIAVAEGGEVETDVTLFNRIGDLYLRLGQRRDAVHYYEQAAEHYEEAGFFNNAIALCNKALRQQPERVELYCKLGRLSVVQGFMTDARRWLLEYVERMLAGGQAAEAGRALDELAHLAVDPEIWEALAERFSASGESETAAAQLLRAFGRYRREGAEERAERVRKQVLALDPDADLAAAEAAAAAVGAALDELDDDYADEDTELPGLGLQNAADSAGIESAATDAAPAERVEIEPTILEASEPLPVLEPTAVEVDEPLPVIEPARFETAEPSADVYAPGAEDVEPLPMLDLAGFDEPAPPEFEPMQEAPLVELAELSLLEPMPDLPAPPPTAVAVAALASAAPAAGYVDLAALVQGEDDEEEDTRFVVPAKPPTGDEDQDFLDMLEQFKSKVNEHIDPDDAASHYDLGLAFKEMGLLDEAIAQFQTALHGLSGRLKAYEELGDCFMLKGQYTIAAKLLERALLLPDADDAGVIGVCYQLGRSYEALGRPDAARDAYERVMTMDIQFRDVAERLSRL